MPHDLALETTPDLSAGHRTHPWFRFGQPTLEALLLVLLFAAFGSGQPPSVNEAHYLCKAKHFWDESWCQRDLFIQSADAHYVFYWAFGYLTLWLPLGAVAWIARIAGWLMLAAAWIQLSGKVVRLPWVGLLSGGVLAFLVRNGHMSGEWLIGGAEAKVYAYALVVSGLAATIDGRWRSAAVAYGLATSFHVLVGGWAIVATGMCWLAAGRERPSWKCIALQVLPISLLFALPGLIPALRLTMTADATMVAQANEIYVIERLPHHLVFSTFAPEFVIRHMLLCGVTLMLVPFVHRHRGGRMIVAFAIGAMLISAAGIALNQITLALNETEWAASLLRYYWFRLSDVAVPMALSLAIPLALARWWPRQRVLLGSIAAVCGLIVLIDASKVLRIEWSDAPPPAVRQSIGWIPERRAEKNAEYRQWVEMCDWIRTETDPDALFVTPRNQQTFKWYAHRAEVANWKDVPQDAAGMVEWWGRMDELYGAELLGMSVLNLSDQAVADLVEKYDIDYLVVYRRHLDMRESHRVPAPYERIYPPPGKDGRYAILDTSRPK